ncbi:MAG: hypothetical protein A6F71_09745 [Cycloclasticus sp. symbiont of Poecilosclerida sp. M]|nr:MAG: hypothetical protein A6F71_09745 [Cycloclasticus sp. symbiont of Poecilosclerida sp. M]
MVVSIKMDGVPVAMEFDTGAALSLINRETYQRISPLNQLQPARVQLKTYTGESIRILGTVTVQVEGQQLLIHVVDGEGPNLLGRDWIGKLNVSVNHHVGACNHSGVDELLTKHAVLFKPDLGKIKGFQAKLYVCPGAKHKFCKARTVPFAQKEGVELELQKLESAGIISPVQFSQWASPLVPITKKDGSIRLCVDFKVTLNQASETYPVPRVDELFASLAGGKLFTKLDLAQAYLQIELEEGSRALVTVNTHKVT